MLSFKFVSFHLRFIYYNLKQKKIKNQNQKHTCSLSEYPSDRVNAKGSLKIIPTVCITNTTEPNIRTLKENLLSKYCKV